MHITPEFTMYDRLQACVVCNNGARRPEDRLVDLGVNIDYEGNLIICETCVKEVVALLGLNTTINAEKLTAELAGERAKVVALTAKLERVHEGSSV